MTNNIERIDKLQKTNQDAKDEIIRFEEQKKINKEDKSKVAIELKEAGVTEDNISTIKEEKNKLFTEKLDQIEESLKWHVWKN